MPSDQKLLESIMKSELINGVALLNDLGIGKEQQEKICCGNASLSRSEQMLLTLLLKKPTLIYNAVELKEDLPFSISAWQKAKSSINEQIEDLLEEMRREQVRLGLTPEEFAAGTKNNNRYRKQVHDFFQGLYEQDLIGMDAARVYQTPFWKSFKTGEPFKRSNFGNK
jgi:hypothetical protein